MSFSRLATPNMNLRLETSRLYPGVLHSLPYALKDHHRLADANIGLR